MPWKAFMQSSALTNSDNQLANELFMQRENVFVNLGGYFLVEPCYAKLTHRRTYDSLACTSALKEN